MINYQIIKIVKNTLDIDKNMEKFLNNKLLSSKKTRKTDFTIHEKSVKN